MANLADKAQQLQDDRIQYGLDHVDLYVEDVAGDWETGDWFDTIDGKDYIYVNKMEGYYIEPSLLNSLSIPRIERLIYISLSHQNIELMTSVHCKVTGMRSLHEVIQQLRNQYEDNWNVVADKVVVNSER